MLMIFLLSVLKRSKGVMLGFQPSFLGKIELLFYKHIEDVVGCEKRFQI